MTSHYTYRGNPVIIPWAAEIPHGFRLSDRYASYVQAALDTIKPWEGKLHIAHTWGFDDLRLTPKTAPVTKNARVVWGIHKAHKARVVGASPFSIIPATSDRITVEVSGRMDRVVLHAAYGGPLVAPLPWMKYAKRAEGGIDGCVDYWRRHAYLGINLIVEGTLRNWPPAWARD